MFVKKSPYIDWYKFHLQTNMYVPDISCYFCEMFANSTFNCRHRLSLHTKGYRILHSRQGSLDRHSFNNISIWIKIGKLYPILVLCFIKLIFRTNQLIAVAGSAHFNRSAQSLDACKMHWRWKSMKLWLWNHINTWTFHFGCRSVTGYWHHPLQV